MAKNVLEPANMGSGEVFQAKIEGVSSKNFLGALPPDPLLLALHSQSFCIACIKFLMSTNSYIRWSVQKNLVGPKHADTPPQTKFECAPLVKTFTKRDILRSIFVQAFLSFLPFDKKGTCGGKNTAKTDHDAVDDKQRLATAMRQSHPNPTLHWNFFLSLEITCIHAAVPSHELVGSIYRL